MPNKIFSSENLKSNFYFGFIFGIITLIIYFLTLTKISPSLYANYTILTVVSLTAILMSLNVIFKEKHGTFNFLLSILFYLGFFFKFSFHTYTGVKYREPVGSFNFTNQSINDVLIISTIIFIPIIINILIFRNYKPNLKPIVLSKRTPANWSFLIFFLTLTLAFVNLKYNILLFALAPSLKLPLSGNAIYFLILTRIVIFIYVSVFFNQIYFRNVFFAGIIASISSIGVLSRMGTVTYTFFTMAVTFLSLQNESFFKILKKLLMYILSLFILSFFVVVISSGLRAIFINNSNASSSNRSAQQIENQTINLKHNEVFLLKNNNSSKHDLELIISNRSSFSLEERIKTFLELALQRWIGIEGLMTVYGIKDKSFVLLTQAFFEKSYEGNSFYNKYAKPESNTTLSAELSTSVPGPVAFLYYPGSIKFLLCSLLFFLFFFNFLELFFLNITSNFISTSLFSTFIVFDFFQFGISPISFFKYLSFTFISFIFIEKIKYYLIREKNEQN